MKAALRLLRIAAIVSLPLAALPFTGCEVSGQYDDDNVQVQFGSTNSTAQILAQ